MDKNLILGIGLMVVAVIVYKKNKDKGIGTKGMSNACGCSK